MLIDEITRVLKPEGKVFLTLCSKEHFAYAENKYPHIDSNTVLKTEGAEVDVPHFFADKSLLANLFHVYSFDKVRHITECKMKDEDYREGGHYFIEAIVHKKATVPSTDLF